MGHSLQQQSSSLGQPKRHTGRNGSVRVYLANHDLRSVTLKILVNIYLSVICHIFLSHCQHWYHFFKYLTSWGWLFIQIYFSYSLYLDIWSLSQGKGFEISKVATGIAQGLSELAFVLSVVITAFFWILIYPKGNNPNILWEIQMHGMGLVLMLADYVYRFAGFQHKNLKVVYVFAGFYAVMHVLVVKLSGEPIYPGVDFKGVMSFLTLVSALTSTVITHKILYLFHNWSYIRREMKTVLGITRFFCALRDNSDDILLSQEDFSKLSTDPAALTSVLASATCPAGLHHRRKSFPRRVGSFAIREILSLAPSNTARRSVDLGRVRGE